MQGKRRFFLWLMELALGIFSSHATFAQNGEKAELRVNANAVVVDVVVTAKSGEAIHGLGKKDFTVYEDGKRQTVDYFEEHRMRNLPPDAMPDAPKMPPHVYSNVSPTPESDAVDVLLLDGLNSEFQDQTLVHSQVMEYFRTRRPGTQVAVFHLGERLDLVQGFTSDAATLLAAIETGKNGAMPHPESESNNADSLKGNMESIRAMNPHGAGGGVATAHALANESYALIQKRKYMTLDATEYLGRYLAGIPGRKNLIWFSSSYPISLSVDRGSAEYKEDPPDMEALYKRTVITLAKARVAVYPIGAQGVITESILDASNAAPEGSIPVDFRSQGDTIHRANLDAAISGASLIQAMNQLASSTGGKAYYNSNDIAGEFQRAVTDGAEYYTLAYSPINKKMDGSFRRIEVKTPSSAYKLSYREGYIADGKVSEANSQQNNIDQLKPLMKHGVPGATQILFAVRALPARAQPVASEKPAGMNHDLSGPRTRYALDFFIRWTDVSLSPGPQHTQHGKIELEVLAWDQKTGKAVNWESGTQEMNLRPQTFASVQKSGLPAHMEIDLPKGDVSLVAGIYDWATGKAGSLEIPLHVEDNQVSLPVPKR